MNLLVGLLASALMGGLCEEQPIVDNTIAIEEQSKPESKYQGYRLVWSDEFDKDGALNPAFWNMRDIGGVINNELQDYRQNDLSCTRVENGKLVLEARKDPHEGNWGWGKNKKYQFQYSSGEVHTSKKQLFMYGRIDVSAKIPTGRGLWPAIWMQPVSKSYPGIHNGEIDIMEYVWNIKWDSLHNTVQANVHNQVTKEKDPSFKPRVTGKISSNSLSTDFHLYSVVWEEDKIEILFDNIVYFTYKKESASPRQWPFNRPFFMIFNIAVGGKWGGMWGIDESIFPAKMEIDYIRYYKRDNVNGNSKSTSDCTYSSNFDNDRKGKWRMGGRDAAQCTINVEEIEGRKVLLFHPNKASEKIQFKQLIYGREPLMKEGAEYTITMTIKGTNKGKILFKPTENDKIVVPVTTEWQTITKTITLTHGKGMGHLRLLLGDIAGDLYIDEVTVIESSK